MPIANFPFRTASEILLGLDDPSEPPRPWLNIKIFNPHANIALPYCGLIDTGSDSIMIPAEFAARLGHDLMSVDPITGDTASGQADIYPHTTRIEILDINGVVLINIPEIPIGFMVGLNVVLLGVKNLLESFVLVVDYPDQSFSIKYPQNITVNYS